jgi:hypothetical protein
MEKSTCNKTRRGKRLSLPPARGRAELPPLVLGLIRDDDSYDDVYYYIRWRLKLEGETEKMGVCTKERKGVTAAVLMATPCTNSLGGAIPIPSIAILLTPCQLFGNFYSLAPHPYFFNQKYPPPLFFN